MSDRSPSGLLVVFLAGCVVPAGSEALYRCNDGQGVCDAVGQPVQQADAGAPDAGDGGDGGPPMDAGPDDAGCGTLPGADNVDPRSFLGAAYFEGQPGSGETVHRLFAVGGVTASLQPTAEAQLEDLVNGNAWYPAGHLNTPRSGFATVALWPLEGVVVFGGIGADGGLADMEHFADNANPAASSAWSQGAPLLPVPTWDHAAAVEADGTTILSCGGKTGSSAPGIDVPSCYQLSGANYWTDAGYLEFGWDGGWVPAPADLSRPRSQFSMVLGPDGRVYAIGGVGPRTPAPPTAVGWEVFDGSHWSCPLACPTLTVGRVGTAAAVSGTRIYVTGGKETEADIAATPTVEAIDLDAGSAATWQFVAPMNYPRYDHAAVALPNGHIRVLGGENEGCTLGIVEDFDPANNSWSVVSGP